jgi:hypothetical protein
MRLLSSLFVFAALFAACVAPPAPAGKAPSVAVLERSAPFADALGEVDDRPFIPLDPGEGPRWLGPADAVRRLVDQQVVRFSEPIQEYAVDFVPSDPHLRDQWALADISATRAWDIASSARSVVVAVVDSGVFMSHPDLADAIWTNEGEVPDNGLDDDDNGFVDDVHGWDFVDEDADPSPGGTDEYSSHGTHVAGIIGATADNGKGIAGVAPNVLVMPVRAMAGRSGRSNWIADGIDYAVANGAKVINLSLGGAYSQLIDEAIARAWKAGVVVVAAAGNEGASAASFPASSRVPGVIGVAATDAQRGVAAFSNWGPGVDITAPGVSILSTFGGRSYKALSGTSMAAPHVSGALALRLASRNGRRDTSLTAMLASLPIGTGGVPRLDLAALVEPSPRDATRHISSRRSRVAFHTDAASRRPPPQTIALEAMTATSFDVLAPPWVRPGTCRSAPCRLSLTVDPSELGYGSHTATVTIQPRDQSISLELTVDLFVGADQSELRVEADVNGAAVETEEGLSVARGAEVVLRATREGRRTLVAWSVDGVPYAGSALQGLFARTGSYKVRATDPAGHETLVAVDVTDGGGTRAAAGLDLPHGG